ncbi:MAG: hypothetical protein KGQ79_05025 [Proteobacteria bacterium]|nr:hypothetical protein [Pseudomonadota bacterium]MBU6425871.1 hypothetical protein [Rhodospirillales bacterium]
MDGLRLADRLAYGAGCAARRVGFLHDAYRPAGPCEPLELENRFMRLAVAFVLPGGAVSGPSGLGVPFRQAWADWSYLQVGDYLAGPEGVAFVASIEPPKPMLVVMTNAKLTLARPGTVGQVGLSGYSAVNPATEVSLIAGYPASLLAGGTGDRTRNGLPDDTKVPGFTALLPVVEGIVPQVADILINERGERYVVNSVEETGGVWRLSAVQAVR